MLLKSYLKYILLLGLSVALTATTVIFGALPMRVVRRGFGRAPFWLGHLAAVLALALQAPMPYALLLLALTLAVGVYSEVEEHGGSIFLSGAAAILAAIGSFSLGAGAWLFRINGQLIEEARQKLTPIVTKFSELNSGPEITVESVLQQMPSAIIIGFILALAIALISEERVLNLFGFGLKTKPTLEKEGDTRVTAASGQNLEGGLSEFRVPDFMIWFVIIAIASSFIQHGIGALEAVGLNMLNVLVLVYFFQGLAVLSHVFRVFKVSPFWQSLWYVIFVLQLFLVVAFMGLADYWLDFRTRLARKEAAETNTGFKT